MTASINTAYCNQLHRPVDSTASCQQRKPCDFAATISCYWCCRQHNAGADGALLIPSIAADAVGHDELAAGTKTTCCI